MSGLGCRNESNKAGKLRTRRGVADLCPLGDRGAFGGEEISEDYPVLKHLQ